MMLLAGVRLFKNGNMKKPKFTSLCGCFYLAIFFSSNAAAQSSAIQLPGDGSRKPFQANSACYAVAGSFPPSTASLRQLKWESILNQVYPEIDDDELLTSQLLMQLRTLDLPVVLDQSARDDCLDENERIRLELPDEPLAVRLKYALKQHNAVLAILGDQLQIISLDVASDPEYFLTTLYNVNAIGIDPDELIDTIKTSIDPEGWDDTNGDSSIVVNVVNGQKILTLSAPYSVHLLVRQFLGGLRRISDGSSFSNYIVNNPAGRVGSQIVTLPESGNGESGRTLRKRNSGIGGLGGGGGVF